MEPQYQEIVEFYVVQEFRATDFEAPKLWKVSRERLNSTSAFCPPVVLRGRGLELDNLCYQV